MAEQYLSDFARPSINGNVARRVLANDVLRGVTQGILETNGEGVTQRFSNDTSGAQIRITQFMPFNQLARELGADLNGENFDGRNALQANTQGLGVDVITVINQNIDIPQVTMDMLPIDFLENVKKNLTMDINNNINAMTIGGKFVASSNAVALGNDTFEEITAATADGNAWRTKLMAMGARLDNGDIDNGLAYFPDDDRCFVFKVSVIPMLFAGGILTLGGANNAYDMLAMGGLSHGEKQDIRTGYAGQILGVPVYKATDLIIAMAAKYAGVPVWTFQDVYGYLSSGYANVRALAQNDEIKIIDSPDGAGVRVQPNFRMGFKSLFAKGNVFLVETGFVNPSNGDLILKAPGSRAAYSTDATLAAVTVNGTAANYDAGTRTYSVVLNAGASAKVVGTATAGAKAKVVVPADFAITAGNTYVESIVVYAEDGTRAVYKLSVQR